VLALALLLALQPRGGPWEKYQTDVPRVEKSPQEGDTATNPTTGERIVLQEGVWRPVLGPGPHTLVISDGSAMTRLDYSSGAKCQIALNSVARQAAPPADTADVIHGQPSLKAVCVPR